jgi:hypothetical protein
MSGEHGGGGGFTVRHRNKQKKEKRRTKRMRWRRKKDINIKGILERVIKKDEDIKIRRRQPEAQYVLYNEEEENHQNK